MAWNLLQSKYIQWASSASQALQFDSPCTSGSLFVVGVGGGGAGLQASYSISDGTNTYVLGAANTGGVGNDGVVCKGALNSLTSQATITFNNNGVSWTRGDMLIQEWSGNAQSSVADGGDAAAHATSSAPLSNSITTSLGNDLLIGVCVTPFGATFTAGAGYTLDPKSPTGSTRFGMENSTSNTAGGNTAGMSLGGGNQNWQMLIAAFKAAPTVVAAAPAPAGALLPGDLGRGMGPYKRPGQIFGEPDPLSPRLSSRAQVSPPRPTRRTVKRARPVIPASAVAPRIVTPANYDAELLALLVATGVL